MSRFDIGIDFRNRIQWTSFTFLTLMNITMMAIFLAGVDRVDALIVFIVLVDGLALLTFGLSTFINKFQNNLHIIALLLSITNITISGIRFFLDNWSSSDPLVNQIGSSCENKNSAQDCLKLRLLFFGFTLFLVSNFGILLVLVIGKWSLIEHYEPIEKKKGYGALLNEDEEDVVEEEDLSNRPFVEYEENV